MFKFAKFRNLR